VRSTCAGQRCSSREWLYDWFGRQDLSPAVQGQAIPAHSTGAAHFHQPRLADLQTLDKALPRLVKETKFNKDPERAEVAAVAAAAVEVLNTASANHHACCTTLRKRGPTLSGGDNPRCAAPGRATLARAPFPGLPALQMLGTGDVGVARV